MAISLNELTAIFEEVSGNTNIFTNNKDTALFPVIHQTDQLMIAVHLDEDGEYLRFRIPNYLNLRKAKNSESVLLKMMELNMKLKMLKYGVDNSDGEIAVSIEIPLQDGSFTPTQLHRCMYTMHEVALNERTRLQSLMLTGIYPESDNDEFRALLEKLLPGEGAQGMDILNEKEELPSTESEAPISLPSPFRFLEDNEMVEYVDEVEVTNCDSLRDEEDED